MSRNPNRDELQMPMMQRLLISTTETAALLGLSYSLTNRLIKEKVIPSMKVGNEVRVPLRMLEEWIEEETRRNG